MSRTNRLFEVVNPTGRPIAGAQPPCDLELTPRPIRTRHNGVTVHPAHLRLRGLRRLRRVAWQSSEPKPAVAIHAGLDSNAGACAVSSTIACALFYGRDAG